ncbi:MAG: hypothetical protein OEQ81_06105 [Flavobacteriaceae bacterium]|nr:hypothetical protein [Flavobacteriaceae bacterium]
MEIIALVNPLLRGLDTFLENAYTPLYGVTAFIALWRYRRYFDTALKFIPILFFYTFLTELLGLLIRDFDINLFINEFYSNNNFLIYNIYHIIFYLFFFCIYYFYLERQRDKNIVLAWGVIFLLANLYNLNVASFATISQIYAYVVGGLGIICCAALYFFQNYRLKSKWCIKKDLLSWISLGLLVFYVVYIPIKIMKHYWVLIGEYSNPWSRRIHLSVLIFMYVCFILGFVKMDRNLLKRKT